VAEAELHTFWSEAKSITSTQVSQSIDNDLVDQLTVESISDWFRGLAAASPRSIAQ